MKKLLLASTVLGLSAGVAAADITLSGDARMGIIDDFGTIGAQFNSRARVKFTMSGESDTGISFGASFRADNAIGAASGTAGSVFVSGAFGKLSMGDVDGAAAAAMGQVDGVGYTGLSDLNEIIFIGDGGTNSIVFDAAFLPAEAISGDPSILYEYSAGDWAVYASVNQLEFVLPVSTYDSSSYAVAGSYTMGAVKLALGYEVYDISTPGVSWDVDQISVGADATLGSFVLKARYATGGADGTNGFTQDNEQWAVSGTYTMDALSMTAFISNQQFDQIGVTVSEREAWGLGAAYDLGGGASVAGGYVRNETTNQDAIDLGMKFSF
ncbi:MAG: porin [Tabrizicola sp.]